MAQQHQHHLQPSFDMVQLPRSSEHPPSCSNAGTQNPPPLGSHLPPDLPSSIEVALKASTPLIDGVEGDQLQGQVKYINQRSGSLWSNFNGGWEIRRKVRAPFLSEMNTFPVPCHVPLVTKSFSHMSQAWFLTFICTNLWCRFKKSLLLKDFPHC